MTDILKPKRLITKSIGIGWSSAKPVDSKSTRFPLISSTNKALVLQGILSIVEESSEGNIIKIIGPAWSEIIAFINKNPNTIHEISPRKWEEIIAGAYDKAGFDEVVLTPHSGDLGRDIIAVKKGWGSIRIIDQVKAYKPGHLVKAHDIRALLGVLQADRNATKGIVTTTSDFAPKINEDPFIIPFMPYRLELINGNKLTKRLKELTKI